MEPCSRLPSRQLLQLGRGGSVVRKADCNCSTVRTASVTKQLHQQWELLPDRWSCNNVKTSFREEKTVVGNRYRMKQLINKWIFFPRKMLQHVQLERLSEWISCFNLHHQLEQVLGERAASWHPLMVANNCQYYKPQKRTHADQGK